MQREEVLSSSSLKRCCRTYRRPQRGLFLSRSSSSLSSICSIERERAEAYNYVPLPTAQKAPKLRLEISLAHVCVYYVCTQFATNQPTNRVDMKYRPRRGDSRSAISSLWCQKPKGNGGDFGGRGHCLEKERRNDE